MKYREKNSKNSLTHNILIVIGLIAEISGVYIAVTKLNGLHDSGFIFVITILPLGLILGFAKLNENIRLIGILILILIIPLGIVLKNEYQYYQISNNGIVVKARINNVFFVKYETKPIKFYANIEYLVKDVNYLTEINNPDSLYKKNDTIEIKVSVKCPDIFEVINKTK